MSNHYFCNREGSQSEYSLVGALYVGCILLCTRYIWGGGGAGARFFPSDEGGGVALGGVRG
jgi:hypothetical protein